MRLNESEKKVTSRESSIISTLNLPWNGIDNEDAHHLTNALREHRTSSQLFLIFLTLLMYFTIY